MPHPLILSVLTDNWPYLAPFLAFALALVSGYLLSVLTYRNTKATAHDAEIANEKKTWRVARLKVEETLRENQANEKSERVQWQLKREAESAMVVGILEENAEAQKILASIVSTTRHLEGGQVRIDQDIRELRGHISTIQAQLITLANSRHANS